MTIMKTDSIRHANSVAPTTWQIDPSRSQVEFSIRKRLLLVPLVVHGRFPDVSGTLRLDEQDPASSRVEASIGAASLTTGMSKRDHHLRDARFFDVARYPTLHYVSTGIEALDLTKGQGRLRGRLTIRGVTREVSLDLGFPPVSEESLPSRLRITATGGLNRRDFGLGWNSLPLGIGDAVTLRLVIEAAPA